MLYTRKFNNNTITVWFFIDRVRTYEPNNRNEIIETEDFVCYFKFSEPTPIILGELVRDKNGAVKIFSATNDALAFATDLIKKKFQLLD